MMINIINIWYNLISIPTADWLIGWSSILHRYVVVCRFKRHGNDFTGHGLLSFLLGSAFLLMPGLMPCFLPSSRLLFMLLLMVLSTFFLLAKVAQWFAADSDLRMNPRVVKARGKAESGCSLRAKTMSTMSCFHFTYVCHGQYHDAVMLSCDPTNEQSATLKGVESTRQSTWSDILQGSPYQDAHWRSCSADWSNRFCWWRYPFLPPGTCRRAGGHEDCADDTPAFRQDPRWTPGKTEREPHVWWATRDIWQARCWSRRRCLSKKLWMDRECDKLAPPRTFEGSLQFASETSVNVLSFSYYILSYWG